MANELNGKRILMLLGPMFEDAEALYPYYRMKEAGATLIVGGLGEKSYTGKHGVPLPTDGPIENYENEKWDAVTIPGGFSPDKVRTNQAALNIVRNANQQKAVVAAICHAGWVLASADIVEGRKLTSVPNIKDDLVHAGANWVDEEVIIDGNLITSRVPDDLPAFCREIINVMSRVPATV